MLKPKILLELKLPKLGNSNEECEDAFFYKLTNNLLKIALADGATESSFAKEWAKLLTKDLLTPKSLSPKKIIGRLPPLRKLWITEVTKTPLPWYAEAKLEKGAFSTILLMSINFEKATYDCIAVGDCCLFHIRKDDMIFLFPIDNSSEFSNNPFLLSTKKEDDSELKKHIKERKNQKIEKGDYLFLMSDALAYWFANENEKQERPWEILLGVSEENGFENWLNGQRKKKEIKNDDTTLLIIEIS